ncbi:MAG TPA: hypothetical protein VLK85_20835 [Ramlibacter sp.]|nr:hypothetical protein [Ramlibacter sp.]
MAAFVREVAFGVRHPRCSPATVSQVSFGAPTRLVRRRLFSRIRRHRALHLNFDGGEPQRRVDLASIVDASPAGAHLYCCGPITMLRAFEAATSALDPARVHREFFAAPAAPACLTPAA